jgi:pimeloyl-ACP methyl ester carboxylesterase
VQCPVLVAWGEKDPWEPVELGRAYGSFDAVEDFVVLPNVGHCPQVLYQTAGFSRIFCIATYLAFLATINTYQATFLTSVFVVAG